MEQLSSQNTWQGSAIGLLDLDAFFASVEQLLHPEWRGKPVIVAGDPKGRSVVSTASYEARKFGVHSAMSSAEAQRLCPEGIWVHPHFSAYKKYSNKVMRILLDETPRIEQVSIDEAFFDVTPGIYSAERPEDICVRIQKRVQAIGITCSIGLSTTKSVAKIASDMKKPNGLYIVPKQSVGAFLAPLPIRALSGIGVATEQKLHALHIYTLRDLAFAPRDIIEKSLGKHGLTLQERALGLGDSMVTFRADVQEKKSISHEHTFAQDIMNKEMLSRTLGKLCDDLSARLRKEQLACGCVTIKLKDAWFKTTTMQTMLKTPMENEEDLRVAVLALFSKAWAGQALRLIGLGFSHLAKRQTPIQLVLSMNNKRSISHVKDEIREKFGLDALKSGRDLRLINEGNLKKNTSANQ